MSKELKALERIINAFESGLPIHTKDIKIIETALKEKEQQDDVLKIIKETISFSQTLPYIEPNKDNGFDVMSAVQINIQRDIENKKRKLLRQWVLETCFPKELKALEIIKETPEFAWYVKMYNNAYEMVSDVKGFRVNNSVEELQEMFDLLKEVLFKQWK